MHMYLMLAFDPISPVLAAVHCNLRSSRLSKTDPSSSPVYRRLSKGLCGGRLYARGQIAIEVRLLDTVP
jgi:hypothetical protein